jgi:cytochrome c oxidase subunit 2
MLYFFLLGLSGFFALLIAILLITFAVKYRRRGPDQRPAPVKGSLPLEITWTAIPLVIALIIFFWAARLHVATSYPPDHAMEIFVVGKQWMWKAQHVSGQSEINQIHVPAGRPVKLTMISQDVIHSFFVPAFRIHQDVLPNRYTTIWFEPTTPGTYHLFCSQYCGTNHAQMVGQVIVMPPEAFADWLKNGSDFSLASKGRKLFRKLQCIACHSADASSRAPVLEELYGREVTLRDGTRVRADDAYLRESILVPDAKVVAGYQPIMPSYKGQVDEEEMTQLLAFIKSLKRGDTPQRVESAEPP